MDYGRIGEAFVREAAVEGQGIGLFDWEGGCGVEIGEGAGEGNKRMLETTWNMEGRFFT